MNGKKAKRIRQEVVQGIRVEQIAKPSRLYKIAKQMYKETPRTLRNKFTILN